MRVRLGRVRLGRVRRGWGLGVWAFVMRGLGGLVGLSGWGCRDGVCGGFGLLIGEALYLACEWLYVC